MSRFPSIGAIERPPTLTSIVFDNLLRSIELAQHPYGALLSEKQVSSLYGVSKTPVREAFLSLRSLGLVDILPQRGYLVRYPSQTEVRELCEVRLELESAGLRLSKEHAWDDLLSDVSKVTETMMSRGDQLEIEEYNRLDDDFHLCFFTHCGNSLLFELYRQLLPRVRALRSNILTQRAFDRPHSINLHRELLGVLRRGDLEAIEVALRNHINYIFVDFDAIRPREQA